MRYSIQQLVLVTACAAGLLAFYHAAPTICLSLLLLTPFPLLLIFSRRLWKGRWLKARALYASSVLFAASAFYLGFTSGPLSAFMLYGWPPTLTQRLKRNDVCRTIYAPARFIHVHAPSLWHPMDKYSADWIALAEEEEKEFYTSADAEEQ